MSNDKCNKSRERFETAHFSCTLIEIIHRRAFVPEAIIFLFFDARKIRRAEVSVALRLKLDGVSLTCFLFSFTE